MKYSCGTLVKIGDRVKVLERAQERFVPWHVVGKAGIVVEITKHPSVCVEVDTNTWYMDAEHAQFLGRGDECLVTENSADASDLCPRCGTQAQWISLVLKCPGCGHHLC
jgi:hypothetical protein